MLKDRKGVNLRNSTKEWRQGFSLIELIVTIAIIGVLVMLASPKLMGRTKEATLAKHLYNVKTLEDTMDRYVLENDRFPRLSEEAYTSEEVEEYANRIKDLTGEEITLDPEGKYYDIDYVTLKNYVKVPDKRDMPNYILQNPAGKVFFLEGLTDVAQERADFTLSNPVIKNNEVNKDNNFINTQRIAGGYGYSFAIGKSGDLYAWGRNNFGQLGNGDNIGKYSPIKINGLPKLKGIATGYAHTLALTRSGEVYTWGRNDYGEIGNGTMTNSNLPIKLDIAEVKQISAGALQSLSLLESGELYSWGHNSYGQLGDGTTTNKMTPVKVNGLPDGEVISKIVSGYYHNFAITESAELYTWGRNDYGQLGDGTKTARYNPKKITKLSGIKDVAGGEYHTLAVLDSGEVYSWGRNNYGQLGDGTTRDKLVPVKVEGLSNIKEVMTGLSHSLAITESGDIYAWGYNYYSQLGDGVEVNKDIFNSTPKKIVSLSGVKYIAGGWYHNLALASSDQLSVWGKNNYGQLGTGNNIQLSSPVILNEFILK